MKQGVSMAYDPKDYWENRPNPNAKGHDKAPAFIYRFLAAHLKSDATILEVGPGVGRTLDVYAPGQDITALDLSTRYADVVRRRADALGLSLSQAFLDTPEDAFPFEDKTFDTGVCVQVLMHIPEAHINRTLSELVRTCHELVLVSSVALPEGTTAAHVFVHDYDALLRALGAEIVDTQRHGNTGLFFVKA